MEFKPLDFNRVSTWFFWGLIAYVLVGLLSLSNGQEVLAGKTGQIWVQVERGSGLLPRLEGFVKKEMDSRTDILDKLADSRMQISIAQKNDDLGSALSSLQNGLRVVVEDNKIPTGLPQIEAQLMDETAGTYNRISFAQKQLISAQQSFNSSRIFYVVLQPFFPRVPILGETTNPAQQLPQSTFSTAKA